MLRTRTVAVALSLLPLAHPLAAQRAPFDLRLFPGAAPGAERSAVADVVVPAKPGDILRVNHVQDPDIRVFLPDRSKATGTAIVIMPGGGYGILAIDHEGYQVARWLNDIGVAAIVCKYRVSITEPTRYRFPVPLIDARQAMRLTREHAAEWGIDPARVGVLGFSAGGHLASMVATMADERIAAEPVPADDPRHRADFAVLVYPVISLAAPFAHGGSASNLLGRDAADSVKRRYSSELRVSPRTPPTFLVATEDDKAVPPRNSIAFYDAMLTHQVPGELHIWEKGGHGFGLLPDRGAVASEWLPKLRDWMSARGLLTTASR